MSDDHAQPVTVQLDPARQAVLAGVADELIPAAHGMPSASSVLDRRRIEFVLGARPDLLEPLSAALRPGLGDSAAERLEALAGEPANLDALQLTVVAGYYSDTDVRDRIGYPGQVARPVNPFDYPEYLAEGLIERVAERGRVWRDPSELAD
jgi:hypothetical protein